MVIGGDNGLQSFFGTTISTICIGVVHFDKRLVGGLYIGSCLTTFKTQHLQRFDIRGRKAFLFLLFRIGAVLAGSQSRKQMMGVVELAARKVTRSFCPRLRIAFAVGIGAHAPSGAFAGIRGAAHYRLQLILLLLFGKIVEGLVVLTYMREAVIVELAIAFLGFGRAMRTRLFAAIPFAKGFLLTLGFSAPRLNANFVEYFGIVAHWSK